MKKLLLSVFALALYSAANAQCNELFISEYVDGTGNDKALEIFNPTPNPINLSGYSLNRYSNGATTFTAGGTLSLSGTIASGQAFVIANGQTTTSGTSPACSPALQAIADLLDGVYPAPTYMNGDDAITLEKAGQKLDILGKIGEDPGASWTDVFPFNDGAGAYWTKDHTLQRKASVTGGVTTNPTTFDPRVQWDSLPKNTWTGLNSHTCTCPTAGISEVDNTISVLIFPNPSNGESVSISSTEGIVTAEIVNMVGQVVINKTGNKNDKTMLLDTTELSKGVYFVKVSFEKGKSTVVKLSIK